MGMRSTVLAAALLGAAALPAAAQSKVTTTTAVPVAEPRMLLEVVGGIGTTIVDMDQWSANTASDWGTTAYAGTGRLFFLKLGSTARLGVEGGYQYFFWYQTIYEYEVAATRISGVVRFPLGTRTSVDVGAGAYMFDGFTDFGAHAALGYHIPLSAKITLPIQVRADYVLEDPAPIAVALNLGLGFKL